VFSEVAVDLKVCSNLTTSIFEIESEIRPLNRKQIFLHLFH